MAEPMYACDLTDEELAARREEWKALDERALVRSEARPDGSLRLYRGGDETASTLRELIEAEGHCCPFMHFSIEQRHDEIRLTVGFPREARAAAVQIAIAEPDSSS